MLDRAREPGGGEARRPLGAADAHRRLDIQGLRAIAVLLVVAFHARLPVPGGFVGVDVFFVLSGFVITAMLLRERASFGRIRFGHFYLRRFLRLTPALSLLVGAVALVSTLVENPYGAQQSTARTGIGAMLLSANSVIARAAGDYFAVDAALNPLLNTWSLSVEEQFYLVFPAVLGLGGLLAGRRHSAAPVLLVSAIALPSFALSLAWSFGWPIGEGLTSFFGGAESLAFYSSLARGWEFAAGALLALLLPRLQTPAAATARALGLAGAGLVVLAALVIHEDRPFPGTDALLPVAGTLLLLLAGSHVHDRADLGGVSRALASRPLVFLGDVSYSWYLWHWPVIVFAALLFPNRPLVLVAAAVASLAPALASYRFVETPLRRHLPRSRARAAALVAATLALPIVLCGGLIAGADAGWGRLSPLDAESAGDFVARPGSDRARRGLRAHHAVVKAGCINTGLEPARCRFGPRGARGTILLAGDSQAYAVADGVIAAGERLGLETVATSHTGCPFLGRASSGKHVHPCRPWQESIVAGALEMRPAVVVVANRSGGYVRPGKRWRTLARDDGKRARSAGEAAALYRAALESVVRRLTEAGIPVVVIAAVPEMKGYADRTSLLSQAVGARPFEIPRAEAENDRRPAHVIELRLADEIAGLVVYDPIPDLCSAERCSTEDGDGPVYQDETHLSVPGSLRLTDGLTLAIRTAIDASGQLPGTKTAGRAADAEIGLPRGSSPAKLAARSPRADDERESSLVRRELRP